MRGLILFVTITDPNEGDASLRASREAGLDRNLFVAPHNTTVASCFSCNRAFGDIVHVLLLDEKVTHFFLQGRNVREL